MKALLDLGLFVLDPARWKTDRAGCQVPIAAMSVHVPWLRREPVDLMWSARFFEGFPYSQPGHCPPELRDLCVIVTQLLGYLQARGRLLDERDVGSAPDGDVRLDPGLPAGPLPPALHSEFRALAAAAVTAVPVEFSIPTFAQPLVGAARTLHVTVEPGETPIGSASLLLTDDDWRAFVQRFKRPDLRGRKVAVLGGSRAPFERAHKTLATYGIQELRRLPPAFEETRTKQETLSRLEKMELLLVCTNRCKHTDTDQIKGELPCTRKDLNSDGDTAIVEAVLAHFRDPLVSTRR
jgi:hypothetical protein